MAVQVFTPFKLPTVRVTQLSSCGVVVTGCSQVVSNGIISIQMTMNYEEREEFFVKNGDGVFCVRATSAPILKWIDLVITFCNVDPDILYIVTADPLYTSDDAAATKIGWSTDENSPANVNFALEGWTRLAPNDSPISCTGGVEYGYVLFPWVIEATVGDMTLENGVANFTVNARTRSLSPWGVGPYYVDLSDNLATYDDPIPMLTPINAREHKRMFLTRLEPPDAADGCQTVS